MSKIIVEDHTKPIDKDSLVDAFANTLNLYSVSIGKSAGLSEKEIVAGAIQSAEELAQYLVITNIITETEAEEIRKKATKEAEKRTKQLEQTKLPDLIRKMQGKQNG